MLAFSLRGAGGGRSSRRADRPGVTSGRVKTLHTPSSSFFSVAAAVSFPLDELLDRSFPLSFFGLGQSRARCPLPPQLKQSPENSLFCFFPFPPFCRPLLVWADSTTS